MEERISNLKTCHIHSKLNEQKSEENLKGPKGVLGSLSGSKTRREKGSETVKEMIVVTFQTQYRYGHANTKENSGRERQRQSRYSITKLQNTRGQI